MADIRSLLKQTRETRRISHPYAKYSDKGVLYCTACTQKIASETLWETHISSAQHKQNVKNVIRESQRKAKRGIAATAMDEEEEEQEYESRKRVKIQEPEQQPALTPEGETDGPETVEERLPENFFDEGNKPPKVGVDEDEWKKFQTEIAETIRTQEEREKDENDEIQQAIVEEFEEMNTLEDRVEQLKKRREELRKAAKDMDTRPTISSEIALQDDDEEVEEEWW